MQRKQKKEESRVGEVHFYVGDLGQLIRKVVFNNQPKHSPGRMGRQYGGPKAEAFLVCLKSSRVSRGFSEMRNSGEQKAGRRHLVTKSCMAS